MNVLITSASRKVSLVRAFQRALAEAGGGKVIAVDSSPHAAALYLADAGQVVPEMGKTGFVEYLSRLCERERIALLVPTRDEELPLYSSNRSIFERAGTRVLVPDPETVTLCQDKKRFLEHCVRHAFPVPKTHASLESLAEGDFPVFVKPRHGKGSARTARVDSAQELEAALRVAPEPIVQELVLAPEYTIDLFADFRGEVISVVPRERVSVFGGESFVGRTRKDARLVEEGMRLARSLRLTGHNTLQCFLRDDRVLWIEVNPRYGGGASLGFAAGAPTPLFLVRLLQGKTVEPRIGGFEDDYVMMRYTEDLFLDAAMLEGP